MAKPDLQPVLVSPSDGTLKRLAGKLGLEQALGNLVNAANDSAADSAGVPIGGLYHNAGDVKIRLV